MITPVILKRHAVLLLDQRLLPRHKTYLELKSAAEVAQAIRDLVVRGAPAIGIAAAAGLSLGAQTLPDDPESFRSGFEALCGEMRCTRPTAVNLFWAVDRMRRVLDRCAADSVHRLRGRLYEEAEAILAEDIAANRRLGSLGSVLLADGDTVLTHCNAGALATGGYGTALGVIRAAIEAGKRIQVVVDETRPVLQGARLTAWELLEEDIPATLITDNMAGWVMSRGWVQKVIVGADRIAANGDVANKIGTYSVAVLARKHGIPFYVAAPLSSLDLFLPTGEEIPIEERDPSEVTAVQGVAVAPEGVRVYNPAFDVTPHRLVTAIITEAGIARPPFALSLPALAGPRVPSP